MPKISRVSQLILVLGIFIIISGALFLVWREQVKAQENLRKELTLIQTLLSKPPPPPLAYLEAKIQATEAELKATEALFPKLEQSLEITESLVKLAEQFKLQVTGMSTRVTSTKIEKVDYQVINLELELQGSITSILSFINRLGKEFPTAEIASVSLTRAKTVREIDVGKINLHIYAERRR